MNPVGNRFHSISKMFCSFEKYQHIRRERKREREWNKLAPQRPTILIAYGLQAEDSSGIDAARPQEGAVAGAGKAAGKATPICNSVDANQTDVNLQFL